MLESDDGERISPTNILIAAIGLVQPLPTSWRSRTTVTSKPLLKGSSSRIERAEPNAIRSTRIRKSVCTRSLNIEPTE